jgi:uncharacterized protein YdaU (DUF1376 family)
VFCCGVGWTSRQGDFTRENCMHYYQFNIGDYASHTSRLSIYEDIAYRRLLDLYYLNERPLNGCSKTVAREIGMLDSLTDVEYVLDKFFTKDGNEWVNKRCESDIRLYQNKRDSASKAGKASAEARKIKASEQTFNDRSTDVQPTNNHKPINNKQIIKSPNKFDDVDIQLSIQIYTSLLTINPKHKEPNHNTWANDIRLMRDRDKRTHAEIWDLFKWANHHHFWQANILSPSKLRKQWDKLTIQRESENGQNKSSQGSASTIGQFDEQARDWIIDNMDTGTQEDDGYVMEGASEPL